MFLLAEFDKVLRGKNKSKMHILPSAGKQGPKTYIGPRAEPSSVPSGQRGEGTCKALGAQAGGGLLRERAGPFRVGFLRPAFHFTHRETEARRE